MEVSLKINKIDGIKDISHLELKLNDNKYRFATEITYKIHTIHDFLYGKLNILILTNGFIFTNLKGIVVLRNVLVTKEFDELTMPIVDASNLYKADYFFDDLNHKKGEIHLSYTIKYIEEDFSYQMAKNSFVYKLFDLFLAPRRSSLIKNLKNLLDEAAKGSSACKMNILFGFYLMEKYMSDINLKNTSKIELKDVKHLDFCKVEKRMFPSPISNPEELEGAILRYKYSYTREPLKDYIQSMCLKDDHQIIQIKKQNIIEDEEQKKKKQEDFSFNTFMKYIFSKESFELKEEEGLEDEEFMSSSSNCEEEEENTKIRRKRKKRWIKKLQKEEKFKHDIHKYLKPKGTPTKPINQLLSNNGFVCAHKILIDEILNLFYFALGPYGNTWPTTFLKRRTKIAPEKIRDSHKRAILETLDIREDLLLTMSFGEFGIPDHIIFFDSNEQRLVLSFKGTSTSDETLHDLDCEYTTFYEGLTHKGVKRLAMAFVEKKVDEITLLLKVFDTKDLLITGHSLGGSLSTIVSIIFYRENILKDIRITSIAFSAAPVVSYNLALQDHPGLFTINYGNDVIPRLSYGSVVEMKYLCCSLGSEKIDIATENGLENRIEDVRSHLNQTQLFPKLYHPGKVYQLRRIKIIKGNDTISLLLYKKVDLDFYEDLLIIKHSAKHHMINHISSVLKECGRDYEELGPNWL